MVRERGTRPEDLTPPPPMPEVSAAALPIDWMKLDGAERAELMLSTLLEWVPSMVRSFALREQTVPPCWYLHEEMVHELLALYQYREQQQFNDLLGPPASAAIDFLYQLGLWKARMQALTGDAGCTSAKHHEPTIPAWADPAKPASATWGVEAEEYALQLAANLALFDAPDTPDLIGET